jgi:hypothetical protein
MRAPALLLLSVVLVVAGCGGDDDQGGSGDSSFVTEADAICAEQAREELAAFADNVAFGEIGNGYLERVAEARRTAAEQLAELDAPADVSQPFADFVEILERSATLVDAGVAAAEAGELEEFDRIRLRARELRTDGNEVAADAGLVDCAGALPEADLDAIETTLALTGDGQAAEELCREHVSDAFLTYRFDGKVESCIDEQSRSPSSEVEVEEVFGVGSLYANGIAALGDGQRYEFALAYEDGAWKLNSLGPAPA